MTDKVEEIRERHSQADRWRKTLPQMHDDRAYLLAEVDRQRAEIERLRKAHQAACEGGDLLRAEIEKLRAALQESACACSSIRECASTWARQDECAHLTARKALEGKP